MAHLPVRRKANESGCPDSAQRVLQADRDQPRRLLSLEGRSATGRPGHRTARLDPTHRLGIQLLRQTPRHAGVPRAWLECKPQEGVEADARGQLVVPAQTSVSRDHRLQTSSAGVSELGAGEDDDEHQSALAGRHHLRAA